MAEPYRVPGLLNPRRSVWAIDCSGCGERLRLGPGSLAGIRRMLGVTGTVCADCTTPRPGPQPEPMPSEQEDK